MAEVKESSAIFYRFQGVELVDIYLTHVFSTANNIGVIQRDIIDQCVASGFMTHEEWANRHKNGIGGRWCKQYGEQMFGYRDMLVDISQMTDDHS